MKKIKVLKSFGIMILAGIVLIISGLILKPDIYEYSMYFNNGFHFDKNDFNTGKLMSLHYLFEELGFENDIISDKEDNIKWVNHEYVSGSEFAFENNGIEEIEIELVASDISIVEDTTYKDDKIHFLYKSNGEKITSKRDGEKIIVRTEKSKSLIDVDGGNLIVYIPEQNPFKYSINTVSGNVFINLNRALEKTKDIDVKTVSGKVVINTQIAKNVDVKSVSGEVSVGLYEADKVDVYTASGNIIVDVERSVGDIELETISGNEKISFNKVKKAKVKSTSGDIDIYTNDSLPSLNLSCQSGDIFEDSESYGSKYKKEGKDGDGIVYAKSISGNINVGP